MSSINPSKPDYLYHYTKTDTLIKYILPSMELRMNNIGNMNDPAENLLHIVNSDYDLMLNKESDYSPTLNDQFVAEIIRNETKIISFSMQKGQKKGYRLQTMWAHYAENNSGVCIEIDYDLFIEENKGIISELNILDNEVKYSDTAKKILPTPLAGKKKGSKPNPVDTCRDVYNKHIIEPDFITDRFFTKNKDWKNESEYRFCVLNKASEEVYLSINKSINRIILGVDFSNYYIPSINALFPEGEIGKIKVDFSGNLVM